MSSNAVCTLQRTGLVVVLCVGRLFHSHRPAAKKLMSPCVHGMTNVWMSFGLN